MSLLSLAFNISWIKCFLFISCTWKTAIKVEIRGKGGEWSCLPESGSFRGHQNIPEATYFPWMLPVLCGKSFKWCIHHQHTEWPLHAQCIDSSLSVIYSVMPSTGHKRNFQLCRPQLPAAFTGIHAKIETQQIFFFLVFPFLFFSFFFGVPFKSRTIQTTISAQARRKLQQTL